MTDALMPVMGLHATPSPTDPFRGRRGAVRNVSLRSKSAAAQINSTATGWSTRDPVGVVASAPRIAAWPSGLLDKTTPWLHGVWN